MENGCSTAQSNFSPSAGHPPARAGDGPPLPAPAAHKQAYENESIARRAEQVEVCARHLLAGAFQSNQAAPTPAHLHAGGGVNG